MKIVFPLLISLALVSCSHKKIIPEITTFIHSENLNTVSLKKDVFTMFSHKSTIILPSLDGSIFSFSSKEKKITKIIDVGFTLKNNYLWQNGILSLFTSKGGKIILINIERKKIVSILNYKLCDDIIGVSSSYAILLKEGNLFTFDHIKKKKPVQSP